MKNTKWSLKQTPKVEENINLMDIDEDILKILYSRGIKTETEIEKFLNPKLENIQNPYDLYDLKKAVDEIIKAIKEDRNIWIYGDYDVDGITSTSTLYLALKELGAKNVSYYIPIRDEGYGLNNEALDTIKKAGGELVITVDCGITAFQEIEYANSIGLTTIITDHHNLQGEDIPNAFAVINPKIKKNKFSFEYLAGVGTIFMVILALYEKLLKKEKAYKYLDLVAIGTVADIVPLVEENRIITKFGLEKLKFSENKGLRYLIYKLFSNDKNIIKEEYSTYDVGFIIAPVFNAAGRLKDAKMVVKLLISDNLREIEVITKELIDKNFERKELQENIIEMIEKNIQENKLNENYVIVDASSQYHHGVIGIAASKIVDNYNKPVIIMEIKEDEGIAVGSCRSIEGFNILEALRSMPELFLKFGGHSGAAGFTIYIKNIELFKNKINKFANKKLTEKDFIKIIHIDKQIPIQKISYEFYKVIELLKPFGYGNQMPTFQTKNVILENMKFIGENKRHLMLDIKKKGFLSKNAVWFGAGEYFNELIKNSVYDIVYKMKVESYQDKFYTKVYLEDVKVSNLKNDILSYYSSLYNTKFPIKSIFYTNLDLEKEKELSLQMEFEQVLIYQGRKFVGRLDYNVSNLLIQLNKFYNFNFVLEIENIEKTTKHNIINVIINRDFSFKCYEHKEKMIFKKIKEFLLGNMEYDDYTKKILASFFKKEKNLILEKNELFREEIINNFLLTIGIYYKFIKNNKSQIVTKNKNVFKNKFVEKYFDINENFDINKVYPFTFFYEYDVNLRELEIDRFIILEKNLEKNKFDEIKNKKNIEIIKNNIKIKDNIIFLDTISKEGLSKVVTNKNIYTKYLPNEKKIKVKEMLDNGDKIYSDYSIFEIL